MRTPTAWKLTVGLLLGALVLAACGSSSPGTSATAVSATASPQPAGATGTVMVQAATVSGVGTVLTDDSGRVLYHFMPDPRGGSVCTDACAQAWPPLLATGDLKGGSGVFAQLLDTFKRSDGSSQVTYNAFALYRFTGDSKPGDARGEGVQAFGGQWLAVSPAGDPVRPLTLSPTSGGSNVPGY